MDPHSEANGRTPSTTYEWKRVKVAGSRRRPTRKPGDSRSAGLSPRPLSEPLTVTVTWRGGAEDWWLIQARGKRYVVPGHRQLSDALLDIYRGESTWLRE